MGITHLNIGTGEDITISEIANLIESITGFKGKIEYDKTKTDGMVKKQLNVSRIYSLDWKHKTILKSGIHKTPEFFSINNTFYILNNIILPATVNL